MIPTTTMRGGAMRRAIDDRGPCGFPGFVRVPPRGAMMRGRAFIENSAIRSPPRPRTFRRGTRSHAGGSDSDRSSGLVACAIRDGAVVIDCVSRVVGYGAERTLIYRNFTAGRCDDMEHIDIGTNILCREQGSQSAPRSWTYRRYYGTIRCMPSISILHTISTLEGWEREG
jgi:hypothetical protein